MRRGWGGGVGGSSYQLLLLFFFYLFNFRFIHRIYGHILYLKQIEAQPADKVTFRVTIIHYYCSFQWFDLIINGRS